MNNPNTPLANFQHRIRHLLPHYQRHKRAFKVGFALLIATNASAAVIPYLLKLGTDALQNGHQQDDVKTYAAILAVMAVITALMRIWARTHIFRIGRQVERDMRSQYHKQLQTLEAPLYDHARTGDLVSRGTGDITALRMFMGPGFLQLTNATLVYILVLPAMLWLNPWLTLMALLPLPIVVTMARQLTKRLYRFSRVVADRFGGLTAFVQESVAGIGVIRAYAREEAWNSRFHRETETLYRAHRDHAKLQGMFQPLMLFSGGLGAWIILAVGGPGVIEGQLTIGDFVAFTGYLTLMVQPTVALGWILTVMQRGLAAIDRISEVLDVVPSDKEQPPNHLHPTPQTPYAIEINHLNFSYQKDQRIAPRKKGAAVNEEIVPPPPAPPIQILHDIDLKVPHGHFIGLAGRIGSGKSTLLRCLSRSYPIPQNKLFLDGVDLATVPENQLRQHLSMTPQESLLFSRPLVENLLYGQPDGDEESAWDAARDAAFDQEVEGMPEGMATLIGERGITLSGGQRQRAALARALVVNPRILLLDDIFSSVDARTEAHILSALLDREQRATMVMVCHRVAALHRADTIYLLDQGRIIEQGDHQTLMQESALYQALHMEMERQEQLEEFQGQKVPS
ncbi:ABC transporter ATP-binding protein [Magnetococcus sp. PR-3]|uniref:ABC transporter ATP-binding protein n=1 Tax=Magnetococcus sp. PR-3 TaxID=3120355 RepID=UPI002FCDF4BA